MFGEAGAARARSGRWEDEAVLCQEPLLSRRPTRPRPPGATRPHAAGRALVCLRAVTFASTSSTVCCWTPWRRRSAAGRESVYGRLPGLMASTVGWRTGWCGRPRPTLHQGLVLRLRAMSLLVAPGMAVVPRVSTTASSWRPCGDTRTPAWLHLSPVIMTSAPQRCFLHPDHRSKRPYTGHLLIMVVFLLNSLTYFYYQKRRKRNTTLIYQMFFLFVFL